MNHLQHCVASHFTPRIHLLIIINNINIVKSYTCMSCTHNEMLIFNNKSNCCTNSSTDIFNSSLHFCSQRTFSQWCLDMWNWHSLTCIFHSDWLFFRSYVKKTNGSLCCEHGIVFKVMKNLIGGITPTWHSVTYDMRHLRKTPTYLLSTFMTVKQLCSL